MGCPVAAVRKLGLKVVPGYDDPSQLRKAEIQEAFVVVLRQWTIRLAWLLGCVALGSGLTGCTLFRSIQFTNVSDSWLNIRFFVGATDAMKEGPNELLSKRLFQVQPGESVKFTPTRKLVHIQVQSITPTWEPPGNQYWLELLTHPPVHVVATGRGDKLDFKTGSGELAIIPERELAGGRFTYVIADSTRRSSKQGSGVRSQEPGKIRHSGSADQVATPES